MRSEELIKETMRQWAEEAEVPGDLASRALKGGKRVRMLTAAALAGAVAVVMAGVSLVVPSLLHAERGIAVNPEPTVNVNTTETRTDPESSPPRTLVAAGDVAVYAYYTWEEVKTSDDMVTVKRTWYLYDRDSDSYQETPWAMLDVAPGGGRAAVLEKVPADRVGVLDQAGGEIKWFQTRGRRGLLVAGRHAAARDDLLGRPRRDGSLEERKPDRAAAQPHRMGRRGRRLGRGEDAAGGVPGR